MALTIEELNILIQSEEHRQLELKKTTGELKDGMHTACAFLNTEGGWLFFGHRSNITEDFGPASYRQHPKGDCPGSELYGAAG